MGTVLQSYVSDWPVSSLVERWAVILSPTRPPSNFSLRAVTSDHAVLIEGGTGASVVSSLPTLCRICDWPIFSLVKGLAVLFSPARSSFSFSTGCHFCPCCTPWNVPQRAVLEQVLCCHWGSVTGTHLSFSDQPIFSLVKRQASCLKSE